MNQKTPLQKDFDLPRFYIVGDRPVQFRPSSDGGVIVQKFDWETGFFIGDADYLAKAMSGNDAERVEEDEFIQHTEQLRRTRFTGNNAVFTLYEMLNNIELLAATENRQLTEAEKKLIAITQRKTFPLFETQSNNENYTPRF